MNGDDGVERREIQASVKPRATVYQQDVVDEMLAGEEYGPESEPETVEYGCGDRYVKPANAPIPPRCPACGDPLFGGGG